ncbi:leucine-rich repeat-containing protein 15-like [Mercenaria mercenaria]|uniref:leucine-rich repeat-containing protein 15-like n=1 Tax=Mercenaria mercenaria TaxID=6596 RepID=UPI00234E6475|nr:leucine-rich repeat-containing protein 15-like [Mercenaria mercenaria]
MHTTMPPIFVLSPLILLVILCGATADDVCDRKEQRMTCQYNIPKTVPPGVTEVYVENHKDVNLNRNSFGDQTWRNILNLQIYQNEAKTYSINVYDNAFRGLDNLNILGIHSSGFGAFNVFGRNAFRGLENITEFDFSGCVNVYSEVIRSSIMQDGKFTKLRTLNLNDVSNNLRIDRRFIELSQPFADMLVNKRIEKLHLSKTNIALYSLMQNKSSNILYLDISGATFSVRATSDISLPILIFFKNVVSLNVTQLFPQAWRGQHLKLSNFDSSKCRDVPDLFLLNLFYTEEFYANEVLSDVTDGCEIVNSTFNLTCRMNLRVLHLRGNNIRRIQATIHWPDQNLLYYIDLSDNKMRYLSPNTTRGLTNLKTLLLGGNQLSEMSSYLELIDLFANCYNLEKLVLDRNGFSYLPESTFLNNKLLTYLSLKGNILRQVTFETNHLERLQFLDLSDNLIHMLDELSMKRLNNLMFSQANFRFRLEGKPVECSCEGASFIKWIRKHSTYMSDRGTILNCTFEGRVVDIDDKTVAKTHFMCVRTLVYVSIAFTGVLVIGISTFLFITVSRFLKRRRTSDQVQKFLRNYRGNQVKETFLCLLSYSNTDSDVAIKQIYKKIE